MGNYFYFAAIALPHGGFGEVAGTITPRRGATRLSLFQDIRADILAQAPPGSAINSFTLESNEIGA